MPGSACETDAAWPEGLGVESKFNARSMPLSNASEMPPMLPCSRAPHFTCAGRNSSATPFMQYLRLVGAGPSPKTWPKCPPAECAGQDSVHCRAFPVVGERTAGGAANLPRAHVTQHVHGPANESSKATSHPEGERDAYCTVSSTAPSIAAQNDGQPVPESYFASERNSGDPQPAQAKVPGRSSSFSAEVPARSVPRSTST